MAERRDLGAARAPRTLRVFREHEADWMLMRTLGYMNVNAAEVGECFDAARRIDERDPESWPAEWARLAERVEGFARRALEVDDAVSARGAFQRASNYYRAAEYGCVPSHPRFHDLWQRGVAAFREAAALYDPPVRSVEVPFEGTTLPGYFWSPDESATPRPTLFIAGGNDDTIEEDFFIIGPAGRARLQLLHLLLPRPPQRGPHGPRPGQAPRPGGPVRCGARRAGDPAGRRRSHRTRGLQRRWLRRPSCRHP